MIWILLLAILLPLVVGFIGSLYVVKQQSVAIIERFGRYQKISDSGIHMRAPFGIDKIAARVQLRVLQSEIVVETKTQDNVFVTMNVGDAIPSEREQRKGCLLQTHAPRITD